MDLIKKAREFAKEIQNDESYLRLMKARKENDADTELQSLIKEFDDVRVEINSEIAKEEKDTERISELDIKLKDVYGKVFANEHMAEFNEARMEFQQVMQFVDQIITAASQGNDPELVEYNSGCGGNCGGCAGCA
jgi:cell fate (sporulation/competence/biofilm development) regulator YlbF (YheA/YmcA/DUF963 family)